MVALQRRVQEGGSWLVRVSLAQTGRWLRSLGMRPDGLEALDLSAGEVDAWMQTMTSPFGQVRAVAPVEHMSETKARFDLPPAPPGAHDAAWRD